MDSSSIIITTTAAAAQQRNPGPESGQRDPARVSGTARTWPDMTPRDMSQDEPPPEQPGQPGQPAARPAAAGRRRKWTHLPGDKVLGLNLTIPLSRDLWDYINRRADESRRTRAGVARQLLYYGMDEDRRRERLKIRTAKAHAERRARLDADAENEAARLDLARARNRRRSGTATAVDLATIKAASEPTARPAAIIIGPALPGEK